MNILLNLMVGHLPSVGDVAEDDNCKYEVLEIDGNRVKKVRISIKNKNEIEAESFE